MLVALVHGVVPGIGEVVETIIHRVTTGHFAHVAGDVHDEEQGSEHGCGATAHRCGCCVSLPMLAGIRTELGLRAPNSFVVLVSLENAIPSENICALFRPPIAPIASMA